MAGQDTNNTETPYPIWGFGPPSPEPDTKKLDALLASLNGSAERFQTLWFSFLGLTLYLAIAALATTHRDLLLNNPQTLPILNIKVELLPFYIIAPLLYLVFHFYLLMMLALLARTAAEFDKQLRMTLPGEPERERYRAQVGNALFLQLLVGMKGERTGVNALLMGLIALITIVLAPLATLVLMQMMFLPYHHLRITWWHRVVVVADLALIVVLTYRCFFPRGARKAPLVLGALSQKPRWATAMAFCVLLAVVLVPLIDWLSFRQGRWAGEPRPSSLAEWAEWVEGTPSALPDVNPDYAATKDGVVFGLFPDRLKLEAETLVGEEKLEKTKKEMISRAGDFDLTMMISLPGDFVPTIKLDDRDLQAAVFSGADLRGVSLNHAAIQGANLIYTRLDGASLEGAQLQGAQLQRAQLPGAVLFSARLQGADLSEALLQGSDLRKAQLQGANLTWAQLQSANLSRADLQGAELTSANFQVAILEFAQLQGARMTNYIRLEGANLKGAQLQGAALNGAQLQDADLRGAQLQGAELEGADYRDSDLDETFVFGSDMAPNLAAAGIRSIHADQVKPGKNGVAVPLSQADIDAWSATATQFAAEDRKEEIKKQFERLKIKPAFQSAAEDGAAEAQGSESKQSFAVASDRARHRQRLAKLLAALACDIGRAPYLARGLIRDGAFRKGERLTALGDQFAVVRDRMEEGRKTPEKCPGVVGFTEDDWRQLEAIKPD